MQSSFAICTLFEGNYHFGVAALVNSLYKNGFRGEVYIGYKGTLPVWARQVKDDFLEGWRNVRTLTINNALHLHFLPVKKTIHLANYKPAFMLVLRNYINGGLVYFDPDIVIKSQWNFFEEWSSFGITVVQDIVSNNFSRNHPRRMQYKAIIEKAGMRINHNLEHVFNSGFCGVNTKHFDFVETWQKITETAIKHFDYNEGYFDKIAQQDNMLSSGDQDTFNMAAMCCQSPLSDVGPEGMDFIYGGWIMSHAVGSQKPWNKNYLLSCLRGFPPTLADKAYWDNANGLIRGHCLAHIKYKRLCIAWTSFIGRFYKRY